ncbi:group II intron reverse transcriptase/maturase [Eubacteriales bacterium OttesenSCG-928-A19]|nr:group II intron reverse transcriptase/maturase [Eubacteriales bacterium OttesenSCG-928-A19]
MTTRKLKKNQKLRNNEYYGLQPVFDRLYAQAQEKNTFSNLLPIICNEENILLAYRNIKKNKGSKTRGTNGTNIIHMGNESPEKLIAYVNTRLSAGFHPHAVRRVEIEKDDGRKRPLGIPTIEDRLIQQCIKQVLEPICEAAFHPHSYGFRPNRSTKHAMARAMHLYNNSGYHYVVDIDIKGFFDNVQHAKLLKQLWTIGIRDKNLISILSKMLKAEVRGLGIMEKGVPQGGILSPLLSNVVLNELDWWVSSQWESHPAHHTYWNNGTMQRALKKTSKLKPVFIVRYADDFKLFCSTRSDAEKMFQATCQWLHDRLGLEISPEKSGIVNLRKRYSTFLGVKMKLHRKGKRLTAITHMSDKAIRKTKETLKEAIRDIQTHPTAEMAAAFNAKLLGLHDYFKMATHVCKDFHDIAFQVNKSLMCRLKHTYQSKGVKSKAYQQFYGDFRGKTYYIEGIALYPIACIKTRPPMRFSQETCNYTATGRAVVHDRLQKVSTSSLRYILKNPVQGQSAEYNDNRLSLYVGQRGKCYLLGEAFPPHSMDAHHIQPKQAGGTDAYKNLVFVHRAAHRLIHATTEETTSSLLEELAGHTLNWDRLNKLRASVGNCKLTVNRY